MFCFFKRKLSEERKINCPVFSAMRSFVQPQKQKEKKMFCHKPQETFHDCFSSNKETLHTTLPCYFITCSDGMVFLLSNLLFFFGKKKRMLKQTWTHFWSFVSTLFFFFKEKHFWNVSWGFGKKKTNGGKIKQGTYFFFLFWWQDITLILGT